MVTKEQISIIGNELFSNKLHFPSLYSFNNVEIACICAFIELRLKQTAGDFNFYGKNIYVAE